jgi:hypothetical protein
MSLSRISARQLHSSVILSPVRDTPLLISVCGEASAARTPGFRIFAPGVEPFRLVHGIVLHPDAPDHFKTEMTDFCAEHKLLEPEASRGNRAPVF